jgi:uncharacterized protein
MVVTSDGSRLPGEVVHASDPKALLIVCHGIPSGNPPDPNDDDPGYPGLARLFAQRGYTAAWFDLRGVREAEGNFSVRAWEKDLGSILDALTDVAPGRPRILLGSSGSGPTVLRVAAARPEVAGVATLAAVATWTEDGFLPDPGTFIAHLRNIGLIRDPSFPASEPEWFAEFTEGPLEATKRLAGRPVLFVHGEADTIVPYHHAELLFEAAGEPKEIVRIPEGTHQLRRDPRAIEAVADWLERRFG